MSMHSIGERLSAVSPILLPALLDAAIKGLVILLLTCLAVAAMRRASAAARHLVWFLGTLSLLTLPMLSAALPGWHILPRWTANGAAPTVKASAPIVVRTQAIVPAVQDNQLLPNQASLSTESPIPVQPRATPTPSAPMSPPVPAPPPFRLAWQAWILLGWLTGTALLLGYGAMGFVSLGWLRRRSSQITGGNWPILLQQLCRELGFRRPVELLGSPSRTMPMTWGLWRTRVLLPEDSAVWTADQCRAVLLHELAHAKRWDCLTQLVAHLAGALYWFNPLLWLACSRMQTEREQACDDLVLSTGTKASAYAEQLLHIASEMPAARFSAAAIAMARPSKLEGRLTAILDTTRNRRGLTRLGLVIATLVACALVFPIACINAAQERQFTDATIRLQVGGNGSPMKIRTLRITDHAQLEKLLAFFPQLGEKSNTASGWDSGAVIDLTEHDGSMVKVNVSQNDDLQIWSEGHGDWPVKGDLKAFLAKLQEDQAVRPPAGFGLIVDMQYKPIAGAKLRSLTTKWSAVSGPDGSFPSPELGPSVPDAFDIKAVGFVDRNNCNLWRNADGEIGPDHGVIQMFRPGRLEGRVLGPDGKPLAAAPLSISVFNQFGFSVNNVQAISDAQGQFVVKDAPPGDLLLSYPGLPPCPDKAAPKKEIPPAPTKGIGTAQVVHLGDGQTQRDLVLDLSRSTAVATGRVVDKNGKPLAGAKVYLLWKVEWKNAGGSCSVGMPDGFAPAKSDPQGRYQLEKLPMGEWHVMADIGTASNSAPVLLHRTPAVVDDLVIPVIQTASGRVRRVQPMDSAQTAREWIDATLAGDREGVQAVVTPQSAFARNSGRIAALLSQIKEFTEWSDSGEAGGTATTNELDLGSGHRGPITFKMIRKSGELRISDVVDKAELSLVADQAKGGDTTSRSVPANTQQAQAVANIEMFGGLVALNSADGTTVNWSSPKLTDARLQYLKGLNEVDVLYLTGTSVSDDGLNYIEGLTHLERLNLGGTKVTDAGLKHLKGLSQLKTLDLFGTKVTDAGLQQLKGLSKLQSLSLQGTDVTDQGIKTLQQALPKCNIVQ